MIKKLLIAAAIAATPAMAFAQTDTAPKGGAVGGATSGAVSLSLIHI